MDERPQKKPRHTTLMNPPTLPHDFNFMNFARGLSMLDIKLRETLTELENAMNKKDEEEIARLYFEKAKKTESLMKYLAQAYVDTNGEIAKIAEFDPHNERSFKLALEDRGQVLWLKIMDRIEKMREEARERAEEILFHE